MEDGETVFGADFGFDSDDETKAEEKLKRTFQSEHDFLAEKRSWTPKIENKEVLNPRPPPIPPPSVSTFCFCFLLSLFSRF